MGLSKSGLCIGRRGAKQRGDEGPRGEEKTRVVGSAWQLEARCSGHGNEEDMLQRGRGTEGAWTRLCAGGARAFTSPPCVLSSCLPSQMRQITCVMNNSQRHVMDDHRVDDLEHMGHQQKPLHRSQRPSRLCFHLGCPYRNICARISSMLLTGKISKPRSAYCSCSSAACSKGNRQTGTLRRGR